MWKLLELGRLTLLTAHDPHSSSSAWRRPVCQQKCTVELRMAVYSQSTKNVKVLARSLLQGVPRSPTCVLYIVTKKPFQRVGIDLFGNLPLYFPKQRLVVLVIDHLTHYVVTAYFHTGTSAEVERSFVHNVLLRHGAPRVLISDRGRQFLSQVLQVFLLPALLYTLLRQATIPRRTG